MRRWFDSLFAALDWISRKVLTRRVFNSRIIDFRIEALQSRMLKYGKPEIFNADQGCQFTSLEFTGLLKDNLFRSLGRHRLLAG